MFLLCKRFAERLCFFLEANSTDILFVITFSKNVSNVSSAFMLYPLRISFCKLKYSTKFTACLNISISIKKSSSVKCSFIRKQILSNSELKLSKAAAAEPLSFVTAKEIALIIVAILQICRIVFALIDLKVKIIQFFKKNILN